MTDHRVTDLSYGHQGKATYDTEEQEWKFSQTFSDGIHLKQLLPFREWTAPSYQDAPKADSTASLIAQNEMRWLTKTIPGTFPAHRLISNLVKVASATSSESLNESGSLLAFGHAQDIGRVSGFRRPQILAVPTGAGGHILRLIKPRIETRGWGKRSGAKLSILNLEPLETGHWAGTGGTIRQIVFADGEDERQCWLATRQESVTTIFRPMYGKIHKPSVSSSEQSILFAPSLINANPIAALTIRRTGSTSHADCTFNPWFSRQFAVIDSRGYWSIWELEKLHSKGAPEILIPRNSGSIYDDIVKDELDDSPKELGHADGWCRVLWICSMSTIVVCNRRHIAVFDLAEKKTTFGQVDIFPLGNTDWIVDVKRSLIDSSNFFVLTTSRIFWLEVVPAPDRVEDQPVLGSVKILLSYVHFLSSDDETLKLTPLKSNTVSVIITSAKNRVVKFYTFRKEQSRAQDSSTNSLGLYSNVEDQEKENLPLHSCHFLPCALTPNDKYPSGPGAEYIDDRVEFFQFWSLTSDLGLISTIAATSPGKGLNLAAPGTRTLLSARRLGPRTVTEDDFIAPDVENFQLGEKRGDGDQFALNRAPQGDDLRLTLDWSRVFRGVFPKTIPVEDPSAGLLELLKHAYKYVQQGVADDDLSKTALSEITGLSLPEEDLETAAIALNDFMSSLLSDMDPEAHSELIVTDLTLGAGIGLPLNSIRTMPDMLKVFDQLVDYWMSSLPVDLPNIIRNAKFKAIRTLAIELCLSSFGLSLKDKSRVDLPNIAMNDAGEALSTMEYELAPIRDSLPVPFSSQLAAIDEGPRSGLLTPTATPSLHSHATSFSEAGEDSAIARLRRYAPTIKAKPEQNAKSNTSILSHWPSEPGADPSDYSYETAKKAYAAANLDGEGGRTNRKEKARRRRRTEEFVKNAEPAVSRRTGLPAGSQPEISFNAFSSQVEDDVPMTQPDRGTHGSRLPQKSKKKTKKRTAGFK